MARYYFHVSKPGLEDNVGEEHSSVIAAQAHAHRIAIELAGTGLSGFSVYATDSEGKQIVDCRIPFTNEPARFIVGSAQAALLRL